MCRMLKNEHAHLNAVCQPLPAPGEWRIYLNIKDNYRLYLRTEARLARRR